MEYQQNPYPYYRRLPAGRDRAPPVRWVKEWIPQDLASNGGRCSLFRWVREDMVGSLKDKGKVEEREKEEAKPEPTTEILFLCSYDGCGKTFVDVAALRKHANIHGERQYICHYAGCGKKFVDSSKLKRHFLIHTGERDFVCPHDGCGKAFSLDFNLRAHMKTHLLENYHVCPYSECGKRYTNESKLRTHLKSHHDKKTMSGEVPTIRQSPTPPLAEKPHYTAPKTPVSSSVYTGPATPDRPFACPFEGCDKAYIHEYKLNLHLRTNHPNEEVPNNNNSNSSTLNVYRRSKTNAKAEMESGREVFGFGMGPGKPLYGEEEDEEEEEEEEEGDEERDSEETEEDEGEEEGEGNGNGEDGWGYANQRNRDDEETEDED